VTDRRARKNRGSSLVPEGLLVIEILSCRISAFRKLYEAEIDLTTRKRGNRQAEPSHQPLLTSADPRNTQGMLSFDFTMDPGLMLYYVEV
jgi:hypothetical protein